MRCVTADLVDVYGAAVQSCQVQFRQFGGLRSFSGQIRTIRTFEDNAQVRDLLARPGEGAVLVIDGGGSVRTALAGDLIVGSAVRNGWQGVIAHGAVRDALQLKRLAIGIKALGTNPLKSGKLGTGEVDVPVSFGGVTFTPGHWVYSDEDGIVVSTEALTLP